MNPAITLAMIVTGKMGLASAVPVKYYGSFGITQIKDVVMPAQAFTVEFMATCILVFAYFAYL